MSDTTTVLTPQDAQAQPVVEDQAQEEETQAVMFASINDVKRRYFAPDQIMTDGAAYLEGINGIPGIGGTEENGFKDTKLRMNYPEDYQFGDDGYGLAVVPVGKQSGGDQGNITTTIVMAAIPDPQLIMESEKGQQFVRDTLVTAFSTKLGNAARPKADGSIAKLPFTIDEFITPARGKESLKTFTELAPEMVSALKRKGIKYMTVGILKSCLQSRAFAESQFGDVITQDKWEFVIEVLIENAKTKGLDPAVLQNWLETRDQQVQDMEIDSDFSDFAELTA